MILFAFLRTIYVPHTSEFLTKKLSSLFLSFFALSWFVRDDSLVEFVHCFAHYPLAEHDHLNVAGLSQQLSQFYDALIVNLVMLYVVLGKCLIGLHAVFNHRENIVVELPLAIADVNCLQTFCAREGLENFNCTLLHKGIASQAKLEHL